MSIPPLWQVGGAGGPYKRAHGASLSQKADFSRFSQIAHPRLGAYYSPMTSVSSLDPGPSLNVHPSLGLLRSNYVALVLCFRCTISCRPPFPTLFFSCPVGALSTDERHQCASPLVPVSWSVGRGIDVHTSGTPASWRTWNTQPDLAVMRSFHSRSVGVLVSVAPLWLNCPQLRVVPSVRTQAAFCPPTAMRSTEPPRGTSSITFGSSCWEPALPP